MQSVYQFACKRRQLEMNVMMISSTRKKHSEGKTSFSIIFTTVAITTTTAMVTASNLRRDGREKELEKREQVLQS